MRNLPTFMRRAISRLEQAGLSVTACQGGSLVVAGLATWWPATGKWQTLTGRVGGGTFQGLVAYVRGRQHNTRPLIFRGVQHDYQRPTGAGFFR